MFVCELYPQRTKLFTLFISQTVIATTSLAWCLPTMEARPPSPCFTSQSNFRWMFLAIPSLTTTSTTNDLQTLLKIKTSIRGSTTVSSFFAVLSHLLPGRPFWLYTFPPLWHVRLCCRRRTDMATVPPPLWLKCWNVIFFLSRSSPLHLFHYFSLIISIMSITFFNYVFDTSLIIFDFVFSLFSFLLLNVLYLFVGLLTSHLVHVWSVPSLHFTFLFIPSWINVFI